MPDQTAPADLDALKSFIRSRVREEKAYLVGTPPQIEVKLNQNESPFDLPDEIREAVIDRVREIDFNRYPSDQPIELARAYAERIGWTPEGVIVGNGSNELTYTLGLCFVAEGAPVVLPRPMFSLYQSMVRLFGGEVISVPSQDDLHFDAEAIRAAVMKHQPPLTVIATPNNPTGLAVPIEEIASIVEAAEGFVVIDEAYVEFSEETSARTLLEEHPNLLLLRTLSKAWGLAGVRVGFMVGHPEVIGEVMKSRLPFMVDRIAEATALEMLQRPELAQRRVAELKASCAALTASLQDLGGVEVLPSQANFVLFRAAGHDAATLLDTLAGRGVLVRNMGGYEELQGYLRVNAGTPGENKAFLDALKSAL